MSRILVGAPTIRSEHGNVLDLGDECSAIMMGHEDVRRGDSHDVGNPDRTGAAKAEAPLLVALQADQVSVAVAVDLQASSKELVADEIFVSCWARSSVVGGTAGGTEIHERFHVVVGDLGPPHHAVVGRGFRQPDRQIRDVYEKARTAELKFDIRSVHLLRQY